MQNGLLETNPVIGTKAPAAQRRDNILMNKILADNDRGFAFDYAPLVALWRACDDDEYGKILRLLILWGCRRQEVGCLRWSELDLERGSWTLPKERSKNARAHTLPLMPMARAIIETVPHKLGRDHLFGTRRGAGFTNWRKRKRVLDATTGFSNYVVHDIRRSVATGLADLGVSPHVIETILNHHSGHKAGVAGVYNLSSYEREVRAALAMWEDHIRSLVTGGARKVVAFNK
jgi:integrase